MPSRPHHHRRSQPRRGFTLFEVLLALGLSVILMAAVYAAMDLYWRISTAGRAEMERAQLARMILHKIEADLRSTAFQPPEAGAGEEEGDVIDSVVVEDALSGSVSAAEIVESVASAGSAESTEEEESETLGTTVLDATQSPSIGVEGTSEMLTLHLSRPQRSYTTSQLVDPADPAAAEASEAVASDLQSVTWFLSTSGADPANSDLQTGGLARLEADRLVVQSADSAGELDALSSQAEVLAAEVVSLQFRYFDGATWWDSWNSVEAGYLPQAIEIVIGFEAESYDRRELRAATPETVTHRLVVWLPVAEPYRLQQEI